MRENWSLQFAPTVDELSRACQLLEEFGERQNWLPDVNFQVQLVLDEVGANVISHGMVSQTDKIEVRIDSGPAAVKMQIVDNGRPFNPLEEAPEADIVSEVEDRPIGGLGLHMIRTMMDEVRYEWKDERNHLTVVKLRET